MSPLDRALAEVRVLSNDRAWALALALFERFPEGSPYQVERAREAAHARLEGRAQDDELASAWFGAFGGGAYLDGGADALDDVAHALSARLGEEAVADLVRASLR